VGEERNEMRIKTRVLTRLRVKAENHTYSKDCLKWKIQYFHENAEILGERLGEHIKFVSSQSDLFYIKHSRGMREL
jgi:hypothetical protein